MVPFEELTPEKIRSNILKQGRKILYGLIDHCTLGGIDDPTANDFMMNLIACIAEGKVEGNISDEDGKVNWSLTDSYAKQLDDFREQLAHKNVVPGPWIMQ